MAALSGVNDIAGRSIYGAMPGQSLGVRGSAPSQPVTAVQGSSQKNANTSPTDSAAAVGAQGSPLIWLVVFIGMLFGLMFVAKRLGSEGGEFANIRMSFYNVLVIGLAAIIGINLFKAVFTRIPVPGLTTFVLAA